MSSAPSRYPLQRLSVVGAALSDIGTPPQTHYHCRHAERRDPSAPDTIARRPGSFAALNRAAFATQPVVFDPPASALGITTETVAAHLARAAGAVAEADGRLLGSVLWEEQEGGLYVSRVAVTSTARRRGIARMLIAAADDEARRRRLRYLSLRTRLALAGNRRLFTGCGFVEIALHAHPGYDTPTWVEMRKWVV